MLPDSVLNELEVFSVRLLNAKTTIDIETKKRKDAANEIANRIPIGDKTQRTVTLKGGSKVVVKGGFTTIAYIPGNPALFHDDPDFAQMPPPTISATVVSLALDAKGYEWYRVNHPELFAKIARFVTLKPKTVSVTVTPKGET